MKTSHKLLMLCSAVLAAGCDGFEEDAPPKCPDGRCPYETVRLSEVPLVNPTPEMRIHNYAGGSCFYASFATSLNCQGKEDIAKQFIKANRGGASTQSVARAADKLGLKFAHTTTGDVQFLEWCMRTRRAPAITYYPNHAINLVHLDASKAMLLDNNRTQKYIEVPREEFLRNWKNRYGGGAVAPVHTPMPPRPRVPTQNLALAAR